MRTAMLGLSEAGAGEAGTAAGHCRPGTHSRLRDVERFTRRATPRPTLASILRGLAVAPVGGAAAKDDGADELSDFRRRVASRRQDSRADRRSFRTEMGQSRAILNVEPFEITSFWK